MQLPPLSLYAHLPWCVRKCPYCDFNSYSAGDAPPRERYLRSLIADVGREAARAGNRKLISVFLGGGTPSLFTPGEIARLVETIEREFDLASDIEITMEANPGTVECGDPAGYRQAGVNRLSIGAQSFSDESLAALGRIHSTDDIVRSVGEAQDAGFEQINLDLMYALPGQDVTAAVSDIERASALAPQHISWYQLTLEPNTVFHARPPAGLPDDDQSFEIQREGQALLDAKGYRQYEISAYATGDNHCRHNLNYWSFGDYLAVGAGAHGKLTDSNGVRRYVKAVNPLSYMHSIEADLATDCRTSHLPDLAPPLGPSELLFEFMLNALRLTDGFEEKDFEQRTGLDAEALAAAASNAVEKGLIEREKTARWRPTARGLRFLNDLQAEFLP